MSNLQLFESPEFGGGCRVVMGPGAESWFVAADVCRALELANSRDAVASLDEDEKGVAIIDTPGGKQEMTTISESGLYTLIMRSRKPEAKAFKRWVTRVVLPSIRKTGMYAAEDVETLLVAVRQQGRGEGARAALAILPNERESLHKVVRYRERGFTKEEIALVMSQPLCRIGRYMDIARNIGALPPSPRARKEVRLVS